MAMQSLPATQATTPLELALVVVTYETRDFLKNCLQSIQRGCEGPLQSWHVIVVDNASTDGTAAMVEKEFPSVELIVNPENLGPARAFNIGISRAIKRAELIAVMNSDVQVLDGTIAKMVGFLRKNPNVDGVSGPLFYPDMTPQRTRTHITRVLPLDKTRPFYEDFVGTTFAIIRRSTYCKVGGYDENYYFYNEDLDWAHRAKRQGCIFVHLPDAGVIHALGKGRRQNVPKIISELYRSNIYYYKNFYPRLSYAALLALRLEIWLALRRLRRERAGTEDEKRRAELEAVIEAYMKAREKMEEEYAQAREPHIPRFSPD